MPRTFPWHSSTSGVYHNNSECDAGKTIEADTLLQGTGGKPLCPRCAERNRRGEYAAMPRFGRGDEGNPPS